MIGFIELVFSRCEDSVQMLLLLSPFTTNDETIPEFSVSCHVIPASATPAGYGAHLSLRGSGLGS